MVGIYKITNKLNNKAYIGQSVHCGKRLDQHCKGEQLIDEIIQLEGIENFTFEIIKQCNKNELSIWEDYYIIKYNTMFPNGYNKKWNCSKNLRQILTENLNGQIDIAYEVEQEQDILKGNLGCEYSDNDIEENFNDVSTEFFKKKETVFERDLYDFEKEDDIVQYFKNNKKYILSNKKFNKKRGNGMGIYTNYQIKIINLVSVINEILRPKIKIKKIYQYDVDLNFIASFNCGIDAANSLKLNKNIDYVRDFITEVARGRKRIGYGYIWSYINPSFLLKIVNILIKD